MIYSVYNHDRKAYDYYEGPGPSGTHAGAAPSVSGGAIGAAPERAAWKVPLGSRKIGGGELPRGRVASLGSAEPLDGIIDTVPVVLIVAGYLAWRYLR